MQVMAERCCGLDVHQETVVACVLVGTPELRPRKDVRTFRTMTRELGALREWLQGLGNGGVARQRCGNCTGASEAGAAVAVNYRQRAAEAEAVVAQVLSRGGRAIAVGADVSQSAQVTAMIERVAGELGTIDVLINNAGIGITRGIDDLTEADFDQTIAVNLKSVFLCTQAVLPAMRRQRWGRVVNISSGAARGAGGIGVHYSASRAGMEGLSRGYAARLVKEGITVNAVAPSLIDTDMMRGRGDEVVARIPLGRMGYPEEVAQAVLMVIGNPYITGQTVQINGGANFL